MSKYNDDDKISDKENIPLSWRERDKKKDKSPHSSKEDNKESLANPKNRYQKERARKETLNAANALFSKPEKEVLEKKLLSLSGTELLEGYKVYKEKYSLPESIDLIIHLLDLADGALVKEILEYLDQKFVAKTPLEKEKILQAVKLTSMMGRDAKAMKAASIFVKKYS